MNWGKTSPHAPTSEGDISYVIIDIWSGVPLPQRFLNRLGWSEGDVLQIEIIDNSLLITRKEPDAETTP